MEMFSTHPSPEDCLNILRILEEDDSEEARPERRVRFDMRHSFATTLLYDSSSLDNMWYQPQEIFAFRKQVRKLLRTHKLKNQGKMMNGYDDDEVFRGLECWVLERRLHRHKTIQCTLSAYKKGLNPDVTAQIENRCAAWSREIAFVQASRDYCNVYQPSMANTIPKLSNIPPAFPFTLKPTSSRKSRSAAVQDDNSTGSSSRRKRRRQRRIL